MPDITIDRLQLKELVRENLIDILKNRDDLYEILEDLALGKMMEEQTTGETVGREAIFSVLENK